MRKNKHEIKCPHCGKPIDLSGLLNQEAIKIREQLDKDTAGKLLEKDQLIESMKNQLKGMARKIEQSEVSQQLSGEAAELLLQEFLSRTFPFDTIKEIPKGQKGGDCLQVINTREQQNLSAILYESKKTKSYSPNWASKLREDMKRVNCTFGIIVTEAMPNDMPKMGQVEGNIWVCTVHEVKVLATILREAAILSGTALASLEGKDEKAQLLYKYLASNQFRMEIEAILDSFLDLDKELSREKRAMSVYWKNREANIKRAVKNTVSLYGSFKSIAGTTIPPIKTLELPEAE